MSQGTEGPEQLAKAALELMQNDGMWPSEQHEAAAQATRAQAMQEAIMHLAEAVLQISSRNLGGAT